jgi:GGDEF domain-containing protein
MQGPIVVVSESGRSHCAMLLGEDSTFPVVEASWGRARAALASVQPAALILENGNLHPQEFTAQAEAAAQQDPYLPVIAPVAPADVPDVWPAHVLPLILPPAMAGDLIERRLRARLQAALRVRALHETVLRRGAQDRHIAALRHADPLLDAVVLLAGRGASYPALSLAAGEQLGVIGALSIEAAAKHLNARDLDGILLAEGFSPRVAEAFLTVLAEDARFRSLPVIVAGELAGVVPLHGLPNFEIVSGPAARVVALARPLIRQRAFEARLARALKSLDAGGLLDPRTGLLTAAAFAEDLARAAGDAQRHGAALAMARLTFDSRHVRASFDAARIVSRLLRRVDFAARFEDHAVIIAFPQTDARAAQTIVRRLAGVLKQTLTGDEGKRRLVPDVTLTSFRPGDDVPSLLARLRQPPQRAAS